MKKSTLVERLSQRHPQLKPSDSKFVVEEVLDAMAGALADGRRIEIRGFGSFQPKYRPARTGRNPRNGKIVEIPAKSVPHFKAGKELKKRVTD
jgi:integration host factor subunit beta